MNGIIFALRSAVEDFGRNKLRTLLTSLGILIGVSSVVLLMAFGLGLKKYIENQFASLGTNLLRIVPGKILEGGSFRAGGPASLGGIKFDIKDVQSLEKISQVEYVLPVFSKSTTVDIGKRSELADIYASSADIFKGLNLKAAYGQIFTKSDVDKHAKIVVIGPKIAKKLFMYEDSAIGKNIKVEGQNFRIIGVLKAKGGGFGGPDLDSFLYMPYTTAMVFNPEKTFIALVVKTTDNANVAQIKKDINNRLLRRYNEDNFSVIQQEELLSAIGQIFSIMNLVLVSIAAISLVVGGVGIMNIMYVTVTERIKEIGIRRAIGATKRDILTQFMTEAVALSLFGGIMGLTISFLIVLGVQRFFPAYIDTMTITIALVVSSVIGIVFGVLPAKRAADLSPIDSIRYE
ncbi:hypothetical protein A2875_05210 [Candidatus Gottesmanbacteria bacterium RIFCSPHIGHO2_01_FULL_46_14]|uniref:Multidrug ABC transporter substrate-binding protein n=3 Tax=Candidatus Gottesmaniibacteriota TaxID=1752720 RepID=A0A1F5ZRK8_9BACT|nr:MAG: hypothetical protein UY08_C0007G0004 [Candidatus Gottesmanbacteria bacterium GW2011_GWA1_47_8]OGG14727.1 MAG: hypothetical protein A2875_05210 [Candidatus Gottesmanbacteria bacterium RIFCSPHIGHO2_01_FULL_46_14]OGG29701.1 MAG: hypothetical protein A2971_00490 [Candidatus Gottesmanbacteria bacterium RIFCSPLOWO2_01_FULL_46_21]